MKGESRNPPVLLSTAYLPPQDWFKAASSGIVFLEKHERYIKQSWRNRCRILTANGPLELVVPVDHASLSGTITEVKISYKEKWQKKHWRSIESSYKNSPYFEFHEPVIAPLFSQDTEYLYEWNLNLVNLLSKILKINFDIIETGAFTPKGSIDFNDLRDEIHPKKNPYYPQQPYVQVFNDRFPFVKGLSIIDILFCKGIC